MEAKEAVYLLHEIILLIILGVLISIISGIFYHVFCSLVERRREFEAFEKEMEVFCENKILGISKSHFSIRKNLCSSLYLLSYKKSL